jgi:hypothetical protein
MRRVHSAARSRSCLRAAEKIRVWISYEVQRREMKGQKEIRREFVDGLIAVGRFYE